LLLIGTLIPDGTGTPRRKENNRAEPFDPSETDGTIPCLKKTLPASSYTTASQAAIAEASEICSGTSTASLRSGEKFAPLSGPRVIFGPSMSLLPRENATAAPAIDASAETGLNPAPNEGSYDEDRKKGAPSYRIATAGTNLGAYVEFPSLVA
jgi:hypothetical protein